MKMKYLKYLLIIFAVIFLISAIFNSIPEYKIPDGVMIDSIIVLKSERKMLVYSNKIQIKEYKISLGECPVGDKEFEGDKKTPEGIYYINDKNPNSGYHKNLGISYPNKEDEEYSKKLGKSPGGDIKIHGLRNGTGFIGKFHRNIDWTLGCIALTNDEIDELYNTVKIGTKIEIKP